ncbi:MAG: 16S rRNA (guanine(966)-N(2))-methyltransferase RsmD [Christensenellaceae bacterium]|nr:16S rRNA (guanine(966)-N(2))-methyltransferase RsmD [Christensenellaceae bacterium]
MRIVAGSCKGRMIKTLEGQNTRPTTEKVREAIFGKLQFEIPGSTVLDFFAGSGAIGIEALSRGAKKCFFVDKSRDAMRIIKMNAESCGFTADSVFIQADFEKAAAGITEKFDFIFIDPPYQSGFYTRAFELAMGLLAEDGLIVAEHEAPIEVPKGLHIVQEKRYSRIFVSYIARDQE